MTISIETGYIFEYIFWLMTYVAMKLGDKGNIFRNKMRIKDKLAQ